MSRIRQAHLELLRHGPQHNQLLSPLTPYLALCGAAEAQTVNLPFEHQQLLLRLARLRYDEGGLPIPAAQREGELHELGVAVGTMLGGITGLQAALTTAPAGRAELTHLRLTLNALELSLVPFETAISPSSLPGTGGPLLLRTPTVLTRDVRRSDPIAFNWNRKPRILFAFAAPGGLPAVPAQEHLTALRAAIEPYVKIADTPLQRLDAVKGLLTVIPDASLKAIANACREQEYTHVHLLAHGMPFDEAGHQRYGLALCSAQGSAVDTVGGDRLALALRGACGHGTRKETPTLVSLATCDSGRVANVAAPGGSIAHELHEGGIPWVIASQFPLWMKASTIAVDCLYQGLLAGLDPRSVLFDLRQRLRTEVPDTHDWASIVVYADTPWDFDRQISGFEDKQTRRRLDILFDRMDEIVDPLADSTGKILPTQARAELELMARRIRDEHRTWLNRLDCSDSEHAMQKAEALGMQGASEKRIGVMYDLISRMPAEGSKKLDEAQEAKDRASAESAYQASLASYEEAIYLRPTNHWVITQSLSIRAIHEVRREGHSPANLTTFSSRWGTQWRAARQIAEWSLPTARGQDRAWVLGTLAELELLGRLYSPTEFDEASAKAQVQRHCEEIIAAVGKTDFAVKSTRRQMQRYCGGWKHDHWTELAQTAVRALSGA